jgi:hypothetical protein
MRILSLFPARRSAFTVTMLFSSVSVNQATAVVDLEVRLRLSFFHHYACWREQKPFLFFLLLYPDRIMTLRHDDPELTLV